MRINLRRETRSITHRETEEETGKKKERPIILGATLPPMPTRPEPPSLPLYKVVPLYKLACGYHRLPKLPVIPASLDKHASRDMKI